MERVPTWVWPILVTALLGVGGLIIDARADSRVAKVTPKIDSLEKKQGEHSTKIAVIVSQLETIKESTQKAEESSSRNERLLIQLSTKLGVSVSETP